MTVDRRATDALYRISFGAFAYAAYAELNPNAPLIPNWHIDCICHHLQEMENLLKSEREPKIAPPNISNRLVINLPPRSLKSFLVLRLGRVVFRTQPRPPNRLCELREGTRE
jgi:hypothetical protein